MTRRLILTATLATAAVLAAAGTALAEGGPGRGMGRDREGHPLFGILLMVLVAAAAIVGTWLVIRRGSTPTASAALVGAPTSPTANAESILAERLARSEISPDDYRSTLGTLRGAPLASPEVPPLNRVWR